ncbi:hypothetical protein [Streptomyces sp. NPDC055186]
MRRVLVLDATGTGVVGIGYLAAAQPLGRLFGPDTALVTLIGVVMPTLGAGIAAVARLRRIPAAAVRAVIGCGALWVLLSLAALAFGWLDLTTAGVVWAWFQVVPVAVFASWQTAVLLRDERAAGRPAQAGARPPSTPCARRPEARCAAGSDSPGPRPPSDGREWTPSTVASTSNHSRNASGRPINSPALRGSSAVLAASSDSQIITVPQRWCFGSDTRTFSSRPGTSSQFPASSRRKPRSESAS